MKQLVPVLFLLLVPALTKAQAVRRVMVESFTQASCPPCAAQNPGFNSLLAANGANVVLLKYQTSWPGFDPMNLQNPADVAARVTYYGVTGVPNVRLDGVQNAGTSGSVTQAMITNRLNQSTPIDMTMNHELSADYDSVFIRIAVKNLGTTEFNPGGVVLHTAIVEKRILFPEPPGSTAEVDYKSVMRRMLPSASGAPLAAIPAGDSIVVNYAVALPAYIYNYAEIGAVAFVQKVSDKQVYQAVESLPKPLQGNVVDLGVNPNTVGPTGLCSYGVTPRVIVTNSGTNAVTSMNVSYKLNDNAPVVQAWTGTLNNGQSATVTFPAITVSPGASRIEYAVESPNGGAFDYNAMNEQLTSQTYYTLSATAIDDEIVENMESTALTGTPPNAITVKDGIDQLMVVNRTVFNVSQEVGGFGASTKSLYTNFYDWTEVGGEAHLIFEKINLTGRTNNYLRFDRAHAQYQTSNDRLRVSVSTDCGTSWTTIYDKAGSTLATKAAQNARFIPTATQWATDSISLSAYDNLNNLNIRFSVISDYGNNLFIDNIRVNSATISSVDEPGLLAGKVQVYPNPASDLTRIELNLASSTPVDITVFDLSGKLIETIAQGTQLGAGTHMFNWEPKTQGIFLVRIATEFGTVTERVTVVK